MTEQLISVGYGRENFKTTSVSLAAFVVTADFNRTLPSKTFKRNGICQKFPASAHPEINGYLFLDSVYVPEGTVIMVQAQHKVNGSGFRDGAMFIHTRADGPMLGLKARLPTAQESTLTGDFLVFQGRGELMTQEDLIAIGIEPPASWSRAFLSEEEVAECYKVEWIAPALREKPDTEVVTDREGQQVVVPKRPGRKIRLR
jgi:hypothetical protein